MALIDWFTTPKYISQSPENAGIHKKEDSIPFTFSNLPNKFAILDLETTGLEDMRPTHKIIEIGIAIYENFRLQSSYSQLVNPKLFIPFEITKLTGITQDMVRDKPTFEDIAYDICNLLRDTTIIGYNTNFDIGFLHYALARANKVLRIEASLDVLNLCREVIKDSEVQNYKLSSMKEYFNITRNSHRAIDDCYTTFDVMLGCINKIKKNEEDIIKKHKSGISIFSNQEIWDLLEYFEDEFDTYFEENFIRRFNEEYDCDIKKDYDFVREYVDVIFSQQEETILEDFKYDFNKDVGKYFTTELNGEYDCDFEKDYNFECDNIGTNNNCIIEYDNAIKNLQLYIKNKDINDAINEMVTIQFPMHW
jgi:DNA polymerase III epsilon subunit family exonuclease